MKIHNVVIPVFLFLCVSALAADKKEGIVGGYTPIKNLKDPHVVEIAEFAVTQIGKQSGSKLRLEKIIKGEKKIVAGEEYRLLLTTNDGSNIQSYVAVVWEKQWEHFRNLTSFTPLLGQWKLIKNPHDPHVKEIADFAVTEYNKLSDYKLHLVDVIKGYTQIVAGTNYRLILSAKHGSQFHPQNYEAIVWEKPWVHFRNLTSFKPLLM